MAVVALSLSATEGALHVAADYDGFIDLFGWGMGDEPAKITTEVGTYNTFFDRGQTQDRFEKIQAVINLYHALGGGDE